MEKSGFEVLELKTENNKIIYIEFSKIPYLLSVKHNKTM